MKLRTQNRPQLPVEDYSRAIRAAVSWLGERYILAAPIKVRLSHRPPPDYYREAERWHERLRHSR
jgi:hypothetical protein